jgi:hypothetical protein
MGERMSRENLDLALLIYKVFNRRDLDAMFALASGRHRSRLVIWGRLTATTGCVADRTTPRCPLQLHRWRRETDERRPRQTHLGIQARIWTSFERQGLMRHGRTPPTRRRTRGQRRRVAGMVRSGCQSIASPQGTPLTMGLVGACVIMRRYRGGMRSARSRSEVQHLRRFLAAPFEHDGGNAGAIPGCIWQVVARGRHELLTVFEANRRPWRFRRRRDR